MGSWLILDEVAELGLVLGEVCWTSLVEACKERHSLLPSDQIAEHCGDAKLAVKSWKHGDAHFWLHYF